MTDNNELQFVDNTGRPAANLVGEEWRKYPNDSSPYEVSTEGRVRRIKSSGWRLAKIAILGKHPIVVLSIEGKQKTFVVKKLVASTWLTNPELMPNVKCIDGDHRNTSLRNLCWYNYSSEVKRDAESRKSIMSIVSGFDQSQLNKILNVMEGML